MTVLGGDVEMLMYEERREFREEIRREVQRNRYPVEAGRFPALIGSFVAEIVRDAQRLREALGSAMTAKVGHGRGGNS